MDESADARLLVAEAAVVGVDAREIVRATGRDRFVFLHRLLTGDVAGLADGGGGRSLLLDTKGHIVVEMVVCARGEDVWLLVPPGQAAAAAASLGKYAVMDDFAAAPLAGLEMMALHGPRAAERLHAAGLAIPDAVVNGPLWSHAACSWSGASAQAVAAGVPPWVVRARALGADGFWLFASPDARVAIEAGLAAAGVARLRPDVVEHLRIRNLEPKAGSEITNDYFPMEAGLDDAIDYSKGCFLGQEPIVRIRDRGHINRRLVGLRVEGDTAPAPGDVLEAGERASAGKVTSAAHLPGQAPVALAMVHVSVPTGAPVRIHHGGAIIAAQIAGASAAADGEPNLDGRA